MNIICASSVFRGEEAFSSIGDVRIVPDAEITPEVLKEADALVVRSKTGVNRSLLKDSAVQFVGTATSGADHLGLPFLNESEICWYAASGCNANGVAEYVITSLLCVVQRHGLVLSDIVLGVIGVGEIGSRLAPKATALGMTVLQNDPPKRAATGDPNLFKLRHVLRNANALTFHVPLTHGGPHATYHLANYLFFEVLQPGSIFINTARGEVVETDAFRLALDRGVVSHAVLDVFENEPFVADDLLERAAIGTPHIAGYSYEGRLNGTMQVYRQLCNFLEVTPTWNPEEGSDRPVIEVDTRGRLDDEVLWTVAAQVYNIERDDADLRAARSLDEHERAREFMRLRKEYPDRHEFAAYDLKLLHAEPALREKAAALGFCLIDE